MTFRLRPIRMLRHLTAAVMLLLAAAVGGEVYLRRSFPPEPPCITSRAIESVQSALTVSATFHHELKRGAQLNLRTDSRNILFRTNKFGMRGDEPVIPKPQGVYRILFLGDDTVCGAGSPEDRTLPDLLRRFLVGRTGQQIEVLNAGVPGDCPLLSQLRFQREWFRLQPDLVLLHFDMTDVGDDMQYRRFLSDDQGRSLCVHPSLSSEGIRTVSTQMDIVQNLKRSATISWLCAQSLQYCLAHDNPGPSAFTMTAPLAWITDNPPDLRIQVRHALKPVAELQQGVRQSGARLIVTACPVYWQVMDGAGAEQMTAKFRIEEATPFTSKLPFEVLKQYCQQQEIPFFDSTAIFRDSEVPEKLFSRRNPLLSEYGTALYAREIAEFLLSSLGIGQ